MPKIIWLINTVNIRKNGYQFACTYLQKHLSEAGMFTVSIVMIVSVFMVELTSLEAWLTVAYCTSLIPG